jgi:hypothetical protein
MATLSFEGETHGELVVKVRRWLASIDGEDSSTLTPHEAVEQGAEITKDALRVIASAAPQPIAQSEIVKALTGMGYKATDATKDALSSGLDSFEELTGGGVVKMARKTSRSAMYQMNAAVARQVLRALKG